MGTAARQGTLVFTARQLLAAILLAVIFAMAVWQPADKDTMLAEKSGWSVSHRDDLAVICQRVVSTP